MTNKQENSSTLNDIQLLTASEDISKATTSILENTLQIFLPFKRIDKTEIYKKFMKNNQILEIETNHLEKVFVRGRLLGQIHKDILEVLMFQKKYFSMNGKNFKIKTTAYEISKKLNKNLGKKKYILDKIKEISDCSIELVASSNKTILFNFIDNIEINDNNEVVIEFTKAYTYFLASTNLINYSEYLDSILEIETIKSKELKRNINHEFIKSIVRYILTNNGKNSQISINRLTEKLNLQSIMSQREINEGLYDLRREEVKEYLKMNFGIELTSNSETLTFNKNKNHQFIQTQNSLF
ncbi:hypothetical protein N5U17_10085 [Aliarcobacter butzleri]|uniref:hypothetical protein n=1 Tax=Aliarcobacter butzleri TaxID=28197 RepID=UPI0021B16F2F|nr:hypothetical protein [Aliarcobacter butzleri]MCT7604583.1 hypothetical protein [Aliarcobacter butzleri]